MKIVYIVAKQPKTNELRQEVGYARLIKKCFFVPSLKT